MVDKVDSERILLMRINVVMVIARNSCLVVLEV